MPEQSRGYDTPASNDDLGREPFAEEVYSTLVNSPTDWSIRVGLFGSWGSGKTTIADWICKWAKEARHVPILFKAATEDKDTLWHSLGQAIGQAYNVAQVNIPRTQQAQATASEYLLKASSLLPTANFYGIGIGASLAKGLGEALRFDMEGVKKLHATLEQGRRTIIILDDLDRLDPAILPKVLLALRDILDAPGFSFLLPFDDHAIMQSIERQVTGTGAGEGFLEKIIDFRFRIPDLDKNIKLRFFTLCMQHIAAFFPIAPNVQDAGSNERIEKLVHYYWHNVAQPGARWVGESIQLVRKQPLLTQKELSEFISKLADSVDLAEEIRKTFSTRGIPLQEGFTRISRALGSRYSNNLTGLSEAFRRENEIQAATEAKATIAIFSQLAKESDKLPPPAHVILFRDLYETAVRYQIAVPKAIERIEESTLSNLIDLADDSELIEFDELIRDDDRFDEKELRRRFHLSTTMIARLSPRIASDIIQRFKLPDFTDFIKDLYYRSIYRRVLQEATSPLWVGPLRRRWDSLLLGSKPTSIVQMNAIQMLQIADTHFIAAGDGSAPQHKQLLIPTLWRAATARPLGIVWQWRLKNARNAVIGRGEKAEALVIPDWFRDQAGE